MNLVDSSGWMEYLVNGKNSDFFALPIQDSESLLVPTMCLYEVFKRVLIEFDEEIALQTMGEMLTGHVVDLTQEIAIEAARITTESRLAMTDSIILATARAYEATLWTQDEHFKGIQGVRYFQK